MCIETHSINDIISQANIVSASFHCVTKFGSSLVSHIMF